MTLRLMKSWKYSRYAKTSSSLIKPQALKWVANGQVDATRIDDIYFFAGGVA